MGKTGLQRELDNFFRETEDEAFSIRRVTKGAFSQSRRKLAPEAFLKLNEIIWRDFIKKWITWVIMATSCWQWMAVS